jgi:hypothetical protein
VSSVLFSTGVITPHFYRCPSTPLSPLSSKTVRQSIPKFSTQPHSCSCSTTHRLPERSFCRFLLSFPFFPFLLCPTTQRLPDRLANCRLTSHLFRWRHCVLESTTLPPLADRLRRLPSPAAIGRSAYLALGEERNSVNRG